MIYSTDDLYDEVSYTLIGLEIMICRERNPNFKEGFTLGKARIRRQALKTEFGIDTDYKLECLKDALIEKGYTLISVNYSDDFILASLSLLRGHTGLIDSPLIKEHKNQAITEACTFLENRRKYKESKNSDNS